MGLKVNASRTLFSQEWVDALREVPEQGMVASIQLYDPQTSKAVLNWETKEYDQVPLILGTSKARVQPMRSAASRNNLANDTTVQTVLVSIPVDELDLDIRPWHRGRVLTSPLNPLLTKFVYVVQEIMDSSNPLERTLMFTVNQESTDSTS